MEENADLFQSLQGEVTEEQWETFKQLQKTAGNLVCNDEDDDYDLDDDSDNSDTYLGDVGAQNLAASITQGLASTSLSSSSSKQQDAVTQKEQELTTKYLNGELTFTQFATLTEETEGDAVSGSEDDDEALHSTEAADAFSVEMEIDSKRKYRKGGIRRRRGQLPRDLEGLMGEANLCFARGEREDAIKMCMEIIRLVPTAAEPFQTLGMLYEEMGDMDKCLQFSLIAAHLRPNDPEEWVKLAEMSQELGDTRQAITCYSKAVKYDPENVSVHWERCILYEQLGEKKKALEGYIQIIKVMKPDQGQQCLQMAREVAKTYHEMGDAKQATVAMEVALEKHKDHVTSEDVNMLLELLMGQNNYSRALAVLQTHCGVCFFDKSVEGDMPQLIEVASEDTISKCEECVVPDLLPIDLRIKLVVCLILMQGHHLVEVLLDALYQENLEEIGDLYLDVAEAYMEVKLHSKAHPLLESLLSSVNYNLAAVWLRYAECNNALGRAEDAATAYSKVVSLAPSHMEARMSLSVLLQQLGRMDEAITAVTQAEFGEEQAWLGSENGTWVDDTVRNAQLLHQRFLLLYGENRKEDFVHVGVMLLYGFIQELVHPEDIAGLLNNLSYRRRLDVLSDARKERGEDYEAHAPIFTDKDLPLKEVWDVYKKVCKALFELKRFEELQKLTISELGSVLEKSEDHKKEGDFICLQACYFNKNARYAYNFVKQVVLKNMDNNRAWNLFCQVVSMGQDVRHNRFCLRLMIKNPDHVALGLLNGHNAMVAGSYKHCLGEYMTAFKQSPRDPFLSFMLGIVFVHMACQKFAAKRNTLVVQACAFLNQYMELRGETQESFYNIGRAMQQLGLLYAATYYYKKALDMGPPASLASDPIFDLSREIAFNLSLIYRSSGAEDLAAVYISKYCVV